jgi:hypothetical protein
MEPTDTTYPENDPDLARHRESESFEPPQRYFDEAIFVDDRPTYRLHSPGAVALASFFGGPLAGCVLLAINYFKLSRTAVGVQAIILGLVATALEGLLLITLPEQFRFFVPLGSHLGMVFLAKTLQGSIYRTHLAEGGEKASGWIAAGIGLGSVLVVIVGVVAWTIVDSGFLAARVRFGPDEEIIYANGATEAEARKLGKLLQDKGYFNGVGAKTVRITRDGNQAVVDFVLQKDAWNDPVITKSFEQLKLLLSKDVFDGRPVQIRLNDQNMQPQKTI